MATIYLSEIQKILAERDEEETYPDPYEGFFLEIRFDDPSRPAKTVDEEFKNKVITADCPYGNVTIQFDEHGQLRSIDIN